MSLQHQIAQGIEVPQALRHLLTLNQQEAYVKPETREGFSGEGFGLCDLVLVMREDQIFSSSVQSKLSPSSCIDITEHSRCHPGLPGPIDVFQDASPGLGAFHSAKSRALSLSYSSTSTRAPSSIPPKSFLESFPYCGKLAMRK